MTSAPLEIRVFGPPAAWVEGTPLPALRSRKGLWLLALLALWPNRPLSREWLAETLWPDSEPRQAFYNLRQCLTNLRQALGVAANCLLAPTRHTLCLNPARAWTDVTAFDAAIAEGSVLAMEQAIMLYRGPFLEGCAEEWAVVERAVRERRYLDTLSYLANAALLGQQPALAISYLRLLVTSDPFREDAHCALMQALADCGDYAAVTQTYRDLRLCLHRDLNALPAPDTDALYKRLQQSAKQLPHFPSLGNERPAPPPRRLPVPLTRLIGRERNIEEIITHLQIDRLVTLTGAGGVGKTRLSLAVGEALSTLYPGGAWFVELATLTNPDHVLPTVAQTLGLREEPLPALIASLAAALNFRPLLLILDNCEHLLDTCAQIICVLLAACPELRLLASSREPMGMMGERVYRVPSLMLPSPVWEEPEEDIVVLMQYPGIQLFVERASQWQPNFRLTPGNAHVVLDIARHLDGIPLAIELAASRLRSLSIEEVQERLQNRFDLLTSNRAALPRHRTLRALIDWSYDLLSAQEQTVLRRLCIFSGGWTLDAAQHIIMTDDLLGPEACHTGPWEGTTFQWNNDDRIKSGDFRGQRRPPSKIDALPLLDLLTSLVDKSLLLAETQQYPVRYRMLETVRQYLAAKLQESGEYAQIRQRHCAFFLAVAEEARQSIGWPEQAQWLARLEMEYENLRAALAGCQTQPPDSEAEFRLTVALYTFWYLRGHLREGRECLLRAAMYAANTQQTAWQARTLLYAGALARMLGEPEEARYALEQGLPLARSVGDTEIEAGILTLLGSLFLSAGDTTPALTLLEQALQIARLGRHRHSESECLVWLGDAARWRGDYAPAYTFYKEGLKVGSTLRNGWFVASAQGMLSELALLQGDVKEAESLVHSSLQRFLQIGDRTTCAFALCTAAGVALANGRLERAAWLLAIVTCLLKKLQSPLAGPDHEIYLCRLRTVQAAMSPQSFSDAYKQGCKAEWEQVVAFALRQLD